MEKEQIIRKPNPALRKDIHVATLNKIKSFLEEQISPVYKSEIIKNCGVDANSLNLALTMIKFKTDDKGRIYIKNAKNKNTL
ncbi:MAG: hypothetical protein WD876_00480 [Candidatus Pacearchaeota archaeon]